MKKYFVLAVLFVSVCSFSVKAAGGDNVSPIVKEAFKREFSGASNVKWELIKDNSISQVRFIYNNERLNAYFDEDGSMIAVGRFISEVNLPLLVNKTLSKKYSDYQVSEVIEYVQGNETSYLVTLENEKNKLIVNAFGSGNSYVFKKEKKNSIAKL
jgi:hypothetical protein